MLSNRFFHDENTKQVDNWVVKEKKQLSEEVIDELCAICLEPMTENQGITNSCNQGCNHLFHSQCWRDFLISNSTKQHSCPMCRNNDVKWPNDELKRIAICYGDPVEDIIEKGPMWWLEVGDSYKSEWYLQEDETESEFKSRMEKCLEEAIIQGAIDPIEEDDYSDMPELMSPELISFTDELEELDYPFVINETVENNINEIEEESTNEIEEENTNVIEINSINEIEINSINERNNSINERNNSLDFQFNLHGEGIRLERSLLEEFTNAIENSLDLDTERTRAVQNEIILDRNLIDDFTNAIENNLELEIERTRVERNENRLES